jgi:hypothetical protein
MGNCQCVGSKSNSELTLDAPPEQIIPQVENVFHQIPLNPDLLPRDKKDLMTPREVLELKLSKKYKVDGFSHRKIAKKMFIGGQMSGFFTAVHFAHLNQYHLSLSANHFMTALLQGIASHIKGHRERIHRDFFKVDDLKFTATRKDIANMKIHGWDSFMNTLLTSTGEQICTHAIDLTVDNTSEANSVSQINAIFTMFGSHLGQPEIKLEKVQGVPSIILTGPPEDWAALQQKVESIKTLNDDDKLRLDWWLKFLVPVVEKICSEYGNNEPDVEFWKKMYKIEEYGGEFFVQGWINVFVPYVRHEEDMIVNQYVDWETSLEDSQSGISLKEVPSGVYQCPIECEDSKGNLRFLTGFLGAKLDSLMTVRPELFWAVVSDA